MRSDGIMGRSNKLVSINVFFLCPQETCTCLYFLTRRTQVKHFSESCWISLFMICTSFLTTQATFYTGYGIDLWRGCPKFSVHWRMIMVVGIKLREMEVMPGNAWVYTRFEMTHYQYNPALPLNCTWATCRFTFSLQTNLTCLMVIAQNQTLIRKIDQNR